MLFPIPKKAAILGLALSMFGFSSAYGSHIAGGEITYKYKGDTTIGSTTMNKYEVTLVLYQDAVAGQPEAVHQDNPAFISVYNIGSSSAFIIDTALYYTTSMSRMLPEKAASTCGYGYSFFSRIGVKYFKKVYCLPPSASGWVVAYQRCCRTASIMNIANPGDRGVTFSCTIPAKPITNNSAVFKDDPPQVFCINIPMHYYHTATDADGDSLTYEFCPAIDGASEANIKPIPVAPPYNEATYVAPYTSQYPVGGNPLVQIDPITGLITGTPDKAGRYLISVCCHEWRNGVMINTVRREYQIVVTDCTGGSYKPYAGRDTTVLMGQTVRLHGSNAVSFVWVPAAQLSDAAISEPYSYLPNPGLYTFVLQGTNDSGCVAKDSVVVWVLAHSQFILPNAFTPNGDGLNDFFKPNPIMEAVVAHFKIYNRVGNLVYDGYGNDPGWDGTYKGIKQGPGVFFWQLSYFDNNGTLQLTKGDVTLIR